VTFASVHDSYWTHACSIDKMSEIIRDTFIALHSSDVLAKLDLEVISRDTHTPPLSAHGADIHSLQFKERYKGFTVPLASIRAPSFVKQLRLAGTRLTVTRAEADRLIGLDPLFISKEEEGEGVAGTDSGAAAGPVARRGRPRKATSAVGETSKKKLGRPSKADLTEDEDEDEEEDDADQAVGGKFVNLVDLLPPLPKKGDFNVKTIKKSQYFFS
jgi:DNA-directed RNA polymerase